MALGPVLAALAATGYSRPAPQNLVRRARYLGSVNQDGPESSPRVYHPRDAFIPDDDRTEHGGHNQHEGRHVQPADEGEGQAQGTKMLGSDPQRVRQVELSGQRKSNTADTHQRG